MAKTRKRLNRLWRITFTEQKLGGVFVTRTVNVRGLNPDDAVPAVLAKSRYVRVSRIEQIGTVV